jgi:hypothetical protein
MEGRSPCVPGVSRLFLLLSVQRYKCFICNTLSGGEGQNRTVDTTIFSRMLYQLSYLATSKIGAQDEQKS